MSRTSLRRGVGLVAVSVVTATTLAGLASAPAQAAEPLNAPVAGGTQWLVDQLTDGIVVNDQFQFDDLGLTVDVGLALADLGRDDAVDTISTALAPQVQGYYSYQVAPGKTHVTAGSLAKASVFARVAGDDPAAYGGQDLVGLLEDRVSTDAASAGRISDVFFPEEPFESDFSNTIGQAFAARTLDAEGSPRAAAATDFLLAQQCDEGFFRLDLGATAAADCDAAASPTPDTDTTALALIQLQGQADDPEVAAALTAGADWLVETQDAATGAWGGAGPTAGLNANSTGLAAWALRLAGETEAAADGAAYVKGLQVTALGSCAGSPAGSQTGAIAYDTAALETAATDGITVATRDQFRRATAQALPALVSLVGEPAVTAVTVTGPTGYRPAGGRAVLRVNGLADGEQACLAGTTVTGGGTTTVPVSLLKATGSRTYRLVRLGAPASTTVDTLAATTVKYAFRAPRVAQRGAQTVRVNGLAAGESVVVRYQGKVVARGTAGPAGRFNGTFRVGTKVGVQQVRVVGEFANRFGVRSFRVVSGR